MFSIFGTSLGWLDWTICGSYLAVVIGIGIWFARQKQTADEYFAGGRRMHWLPIGLSIFAGTFSSLSFVGLPSEAAYEDYHLYLGILFIPFVVMPIVGWLFIPLFHRLRGISPYIYLERRFNRFVRVLASLLFMAFTIAWMGNMLVAVGRILQVVLDLDATELSLVLIGVGLLATIYTTLGGVKAVVWTDALQAVTLGGGMLIVLFLAVSRVDGGWTSVWEIGNQHDKFDMFKMELDLTKGNFFAACAFGFFVYLAGHAVHFTAVQRYVSMPTIRAARRSLVVNGIAVAVVCLIFFLVGTTIFVFYKQHDGGSNRPSTAATESEKETAAQTNWFLDLKNKPKQQDQLLPRFMMSEIHVAGLMGLLLAGLFAAAMSSIDSGINSLTASVASDWLPGKRVNMVFSKVLCFIFGIAAIGVAMYLQQLQENVFNMIKTIAGGFLGPLLGLFLLGLLSPRANTGGAMIGLFGGLAAYLAMKLSGLSHWWDGACTCISVLFIGLFASLLFPPPDERKLIGLSVGKQRRLV
ncbi:MAG: sodium/solute symporter, partial [Planctomycetes bacterium]|nr:sodium/solute symporter [Planctomycetota bacterium]